MEALAELNHHWMHISFSPVVAHVIFVADRYVEYAHFSPTQPNLLLTVYSKAQTVSFTSLNYVIKFMFNKIIDSSLFSPWKHGLSLIFRHFNSCLMLLKSECQFDYLVNYLKCSDKKVNGMEPNQTPLGFVWTGFCTLCSDLSEYLFLEENMTRHLIRVNF